MWKGIVRTGPSYGKKGGNKITEDDIVVLKDDFDPSQIKMTNPIKIYERKKAKYLTYDQILILILSILIIGLILIKFIFNDIFKTQAQKNFELLISTLSYAFITSYIFYLLVIKRKELIKNRETYAVICGLTESVIANGEKILDLIAKAADKEKEVEKLKKIDLEVIETLCEKADISKVEPGNRLNIGQLIIVYGTKKTNFYIEKIYTFMPFLEGEYIKKLNKIQNSSFYREITILPYKKEYNLKGFSKDILQFLDLLQDLKSHNDSLKNKYLKNYENTL